MNLIIESTIIDHDLRKKLGLSIPEYCVMCAIYLNGDLSLNELAFNFSMTKREMIDLVKRLVKKGYLERITIPDSAAVELMDIDLNRKNCVSCSGSYRLQNHHYPVRKADGGNETVLLCEKCHIQFHKLTDRGILSRTLYVEFPKPINKC